MYRTYNPPGSASSQTPEYWRSWWQHLPSDADIAKLERTEEWELLEPLLKKGDRVLEAGCGSAVWARFLKRRGWNAEGLDFEEDVITRLQERFPEMPWHLADIRNMPFPDGTFDVILCWGVVEHFENGPDELLREFARTLAPEGRAFISVPYLNRLRQRTFPGTSNRSVVGDGAVFNQNYFTASEFCERLSAAGLVVRETVPFSRDFRVVFPALGPILPHLIVRALNRLTRWFLPAEASAHMIVAICTKGAKSMG